MTIREIMDTTPPVKVKLLTYGRDGNTVVVHHQPMHPVSGNFYVYKTKPDSYEQYSLRFAALFPCGFAVCFGSLSRYDEESAAIRYYPSFSAEEGETLPIMEVIQRMGADYQNSDAFLRRIDAHIAERRFIQRLELRLVAEILRDTPDHGEAMLKRYSAAKEAIDSEREAQRRLASEQRRIEEAAKEQREKDAWERRIQRAERAFMSDGSDIPVDIDALFEIIRRLGVAVPINVKGWMRRNLAFMTIQDGLLSSYRYRKTPSRTIFEYMNRVLDALRKEHGGEVS